MDRHFGLESVCASENASGAESARRAVTALGVFDGVHVGHREVLRQVCDWASELDAEPWMITFANHPDTLLRQRTPAPITTLDQRLELLEEAGIAHCWILDFDERLRAVSAEQFVRDLLVARVGVVGVVLGDGARFGKGGLGSIDTLAELGPECGFQARSVGKLPHEGEVVSSTRIRAAIRAGDLGEAWNMLGRPFALRRVVVSGDGRGRSIGVPTANLEGPFELLPPLGVYVSRVHARTGSDAAWQPLGFGVTNIGRRPTFDGGTAGLDHVTVETHVLDFDGDLAGATLELALLERVREERSFDGAEALVAQIREDMDWARGRLREWKVKLGIDLTPQSGEL